MIAGFSELRQFSKGAYLFHEGDSSAGFYVVQRGLIRLHRTNAVGKEQVIHLCRAGESFAEASLVDPSRYPVSAQATEASAVILVPRVRFIDLLRRHPDLALRFIAALGRRLRQLVDLVEDLRLRDSETRLLSWLSRKYSSGRPLTVELDVTKRIFASEMGMTSETLSRTFTKLRELGLIRVDGRRIEILDPSALKQRLADLLAGADD